MTSKTYYIEYDENFCAFLVDVNTKERIAIEHGMILKVIEIKKPLYDVSQLSRMLR